MGQRAYEHVQTYLGEHQAMQTDLEEYQDMQTDLWAHLLATLWKTVARGGAPGSTEPKVGPLPSSLHMAAPVTPQCRLCTCAPSLLTRTDLARAINIRGVGGSKWKQTLCCSFLSFSVTLVHRLVEFGLNVLFYGFLELLESSMWL